MNPFRFRLVRELASTWLGAASDSFLLLAVAAHKAPKKEPKVTPKPRWYEHAEK